jgi:uncharacterized membrane protein
MTGRIFSIALISFTGLMVAASTGCGDSSSDGLGGGSATGPEVDCASVEVKGYSELTIWSTCTECHATTLVGSQARQAAPEGSDYDTYEAARATAEEAQDQVFKGLMPPSGFAAPTEQEKQDLYAWVQCGQPE